MRKALFLIFFISLFLFSVSVLGVTTTDTVGDTSSSGSEGETEASPIIASASGTLDSVGVNIYSCAGGNPQMAIYADSGSNVPTTRLGLSSPFACSVGWMDFPITGVDIIEGTKYWVAFASYSGNIYYKLSAIKRWLGDDYTLPNPFDTVYSDTILIWNVRMTYTSCSPDYQLNSTEDDCHNSTNYAHNTTYYDSNECDEEYPFIINYTYPVLDYELGGLSNTCLNETNTNTTYDYQDVLSCGYHIYNSTFPVLDYDLFSTEDDCLNETNFIRNHTYKDNREPACGYSFSNYTYPEMFYHYSNTLDNCLNDTNYNLTSIYSNSTCGYSFSTEEFPNLDYILYDTIDSCHNETNSNTTYYYMDTHDPVCGYFIYNSTFPGLGYDYFSASANCYNDTALNTTTIYHDILDCGYENSTFSLSNCQYLCFDEECRFAISDGYIFKKYCNDTYLVDEVLYIENYSQINKTDRFNYCNYGCDSIIDDCSPNPFYSILILIGGIFGFLFLMYFGYKVIRRWA